MGERIVLKETFFPTDIVTESVEYINESTGKKELKDTVKIKGLFQIADEKNRNGRIYPKKIFERVLANNSSFMKRLKERQILGELEHPEDDRTDLKRVAIILTNITMNGNKILGEAEVLDTPNGRIVKELLSKGVKIGVSSRGTGSVSVNSKGDSVVQEDYQLETWDVVYSPSVETAIPEVVESIDKKENLDVSYIREQESSKIESSNNNKVFKNLGERTVPNENVIQILTDLRTIRESGYDKPLSDLLESKEKVINCLVSLINEDSSSDKVIEAKSLAISTRDLINEKLKTKIKELQESDQDLIATAESYKSQLEESEKKVSKLNSLIEEMSKEKEEKDKDSEEGKEDKESSDDEEDSEDKEKEDKVEETYIKVIESLRDKVITSEGSLESSQGVLEAMTEKYNVIEKVVEGLAKRCNESETALESVLEKYNKTYDSTEFLCGIVEGLVEEYNKIDSYSKAIEEKFAGEYEKSRMAIDLAESLANKVRGSVTIIEKLRDSVLESREEANNLKESIKDSEVKSAINEAIKENPSLSEAIEILNECKSVEEVIRKSESLAKITRGRAKHGLPEVGLAMRGNTLNETVKKTGSKKKGAVPPPPGLKRLVKGMGENLDI